MWRAIIKGMTVGASLLTLWRCGLKVLKFLKAEVGKCIVVFPSKMTVSV